MAIGNVCDPRPVKTGSPMWSMKEFDSRFIGVVGGDQEGGGGGGWGCDIGYVALTPLWELTTCLLSLVCY